MFGKGFYTAQEGHLVNILPPVDISSGKLAQSFFLGRHGHATIVVQVGVSAAAFTKIIVSLCDDASGTNPVAIGFDVFKQETAGASNDVLGTRTTVAAAGLTPSANDGIFYVIELDGDQIPAGFGVSAAANKTYVQLSLTNGVNSVIASALAILSGPRFESDQSETVTA